MKYINSFNINTNNLPEKGLSRQYTIEGEKDAEFILQVFNSAQQFYDFKTKSFSATFTSTSSLNIKMKGSSYNGNINFPTNASGDTYTILLLAPPDKETELTFASGKNSYSTTITQVADTTLSFTPVSLAASANYQTFSSTGAASIESVASPALTSSVVKALDWDLKNTESDAAGFGLRLIRQPINTDWYLQNTEAISSNPAGDGVSNNTVIVADLTDIATGMELIYHKGTTAPSATTVITAINQSTKVITFSTSTAFEDGETMTLRAKGSGVIKKAIGADIDFSTWNANVTSATSAELTKTVRTDISSTTVTLNGTYGISGGNFVTIAGVGVNNSATNKVVSVSASSSAGSMVMTLSQTLSGGTNGTKLYFTGSTQTINVKNNIVINKQPSSDREIFLNLDNFITVGRVS